MEKTRKGGLLREAFEKPLKSGFYFIDGWVERQKKTEGAFGVRHQLLATRMIAPQILPALLPARFEVHGILQGAWKE